MRKYTMKKELLRLAITRFTTTFITFKSLHDQKANLRKMFTSDDWRKTKWAKEVRGKSCVKITLMESFWKNIVFALKLAGPLVKVLRMVDSDKPSMGYIYCAIDRVKEAMLKSFNGQEEKCKKAIDIIDKRWECQLHHPLHAAGYFLNRISFMMILKEFLQTQKDQDEVQDEFPKYINGEGLFGRHIAIRAREKNSPASYKKKKLVIIIKIERFGLCQIQHGFDSLDMVDQASGASDLIILVDQRLRKPRIKKKLHEEEFDFIEEIDEEENIMELGDDDDHLLQDEDIDIDSETD
ncbi:hypothetical protein V2J09_021657 [Rumex salicifolius]